MKEGGNDARRRSAREGGRGEQRGEQRGERRGDGDEGPEGEEEEGSQEQNVVRNDE